MPIYLFVCDICRKQREIKESIKKPVPRPPRCDTCGHIMNRVFECNFILKGTGWPGKSLKKRQYESAEEKEKNDQQWIEDQRNQRTVDEVIKIRRKGRKAIEQFKKEHPQKYYDYVEAMKKGYRSRK